MRAARKTRLVFLSAMRPPPRQATRSVAGCPRPGWDEQVPPQPRHNVLLASYGRASDNTEFSLPPRAEFCRQLGNGGKELMSAQSVPAPSRCSLPDSQVVALSAVVLLRLSCRWSDRPARCPGANTPFSRTQTIYL